MKKLLAALLLAVAMPAAAVDQLVKFELPTLYEDGAPVLPGELLQVRIEWGNCTGTAATGYTFGAKLGEVIALDPTTEATIVGLSMGKSYCFRGFAVTDKLEESVASNILRKFYSWPRTKPIVIAF